MTARLIKGGVAVDDRGALQFVNDFDVSCYQRFYVISSHQPRFVRAWHGHKVEGKAFTVVVGAAVIGAVAIDDWVNPDTSRAVQRVVLSHLSIGICRAARLCEWIDDSSSQHPDPCFLDTFSRGRKSR